MYVLRAAALSLFAAGCATASKPGPDQRADAAEDDVDAAVIVFEVDADIGPDDIDAAVAPGIDAAVAPDIDAAVAPDIDAGGPCTITVTQLLLNPSFDSGPGGGWSESSGGGYPIIVHEGAAEGDLPIAAQTPIYAAWLGGYYDGTDTLSQSVTVPADATALEISGYQLVGTEETGTTPFDYAFVELRTTGGGTLEVLGDPDGDGITWSNADGGMAWVPFAFTAVSPHAGQTIQLYVEATVDFTLNTNFFLDTMAVRVTRCL